MNHSVYGSSLREAAWERINWGRVILGGLVAGVILGIGEFVLHEFLFGARMEAALSEMGLGEPTGSDIGIFTGLTLLLGVLVRVLVRLQPGVGPVPAGPHADLHRVGALRAPGGDAGGRVAVPRIGGRLASRIALIALLAGSALACSTGDPDPAPADAGRIERTTARVDSALEPARARMRAIDSLGRSAE